MALTRAMSGEISVLTPWTSVWIPLLGDGSFSFQAQVRQSGAGS